MKKEKPEGREEGRMSYKEAAKVFHEEAPARIKLNERIVIIPSRGPFKDQELLLIGRSKTPGNLLLVSGADLQTVLDLSIEDIKKGRVMRATAQFFPSDKEQ